MKLCRLLKEPLCVCVLGGNMQWLWALCSFLQPFQMSQWPAVIWKGSSQLQVSLICSSHLLIERSLLGLVCIPVKVVWILFFFSFPLFNTVLHTRFPWRFWSHEDYIEILVRFAFHSSRVLLNQFLCSSNGTQRVEPEMSQQSAEVTWIALRTMPTSRR